MPTITRAHADLEDFLRILEPESPTDPLVRDDDRRFFDEHGGPRPERSIFRVLFAADVVSDGGQAGVDALEVALSHPASGARDLAVEAADYLLSAGDVEVDAIFEVLRLHEFDPDPRVAAAIRRTISRMGLWTMTPSHVLGGRLARETRIGRSDIMGGRGSPGSRSQR